MAGRPQSRLAALTLMLALSVGCDLVSGLNDFRLPGGSGGAGVSTGGAGSGGEAGGGGEAGRGGEAGGEPMPLGPFVEAALVEELNSGMSDDDPTMTADGLELYLNSNRNNQNGIFRSTRPSTEAPWATPTRVPPLSDNIQGETNPVIAPDGLTLWIRGDIGGGMETLVSRRADRSAAWPPPVEDMRLSAPSGWSLNSVSADLLRVVHSDLAGELYEATRSSPDDDWGSAVLLDAITRGPMNRYQGRLRPDGLSMVWIASGDLYRTTRPSLSEDFLSGERVEELDPYDMSDPWLTGDESYLLFVQGMGDGRDIYEARRYPR